LRAVDNFGNVAQVTGNTAQDATHGWISGHRYLVDNVKEHSGVEFVVSPRLQKRLPLDIAASKHLRAGM